MAMNSSSHRSDSMLNPGELFLDHSSLWIDLFCAINLCEKQMIYYVIRANFRDKSISVFKAY